MLCVLGQPLLLEVDEFMMEFFGGYSERLAHGLEKIHKKH